MGPWSDRFQERIGQGSRATSPEGAFCTAVAAPTGPTPGDFRRKSGGTPWGPRGREKDTPPHDAEGEQLWSAVPWHRFPAPEQRNRG